MVYYGAGVCVPCVLYTLCCGVLLNPAGVHRGVAVVCALLCCCALHVVRCMLCVAPPGGWVLGVCALLCCCALHVVRCMLCAACCALLRWGWVGVRGVCRCPAVRTLCDVNHGCVSVCSPFCWLYLCLPQGAPRGSGSGVLAGGWRLGRQQHLQGHWGGDAVEQGWPWVYVCPRTLGSSWVEPYSLHYVDSSTF